MTNKMTNKKAIAYVLENMTEMPADVREKLEAMMASLEKKSSSGERKPTKTQLENAGLRDAILAYMRSDPNRLMTCTEIGKAVPELNGANNQKVSSLVRVLLADGKVTKTSEKGRSYFQYAGNDEVEGE